MKRKVPPPAVPSQPSALAALERAAQKAVELARRTGTSAWILEDGKLVDAAKSPPRPAIKNGRRQAKK